MKFIIIAVLVIFSSRSFAQGSPAETLAHKIAYRMRDSLDLNAADTDSIYRLNIMLHERKMTARKTITDRDELRNALQQIENSRDALYSGVLSADKFLLYRQKKFNLVNAQ